MNKIKITNQQLYQLIKLQAQLPITKPDDLKENTAENIKAAIWRCRELKTELEELEFELDNAITHIYEHNLEGLITTTDNCIKRTKEISEDVSDVANFVAGSTAKFIEVSEIADSFTLTVTPDEIKETIDKNFEIHPVMSVGYNNGNYALLFGEDEETVDTDPYIFANGSSDDYAAVQSYIESFLDLEDPE